MKHFYVIVKIIYYIITILIGMFFLRGGLLFGDDYTVILGYLIPGYMVLCGIMCGYIISKLRLVHNEDPTRENSILLRSFVIGILLGVGLSLSYIFLK